MIKYKLKPKIHTVFNQICYRKNSYDSLIIFMKTKALDSMIWNIVTELKSMLWNFVQKQEEYSRRPLGASNTSDA